ncbi:MAG: hypothetical protein JWM74_2882, partial [Myxococcaceae bacterium]|nr:hypothetical protein [Myxococcaceae bacterium]
FYDGRTMLLEPMLTNVVLWARRSFRIPLPKPPSLGGARTRFPTSFDARYDAAGDAYDLVFGSFVTID